jgi:transposase-like protein
MIEQKQWLNEKGQCPVCMRKPLVYKRDHVKFCARCNRNFNIETGEQVENWGWRQVSPDSFEYRYER